MHLHLHFSILLKIKSNQVWTVFPSWLKFWSFFFPFFGGRAKEEKFQAVRGRNVTIERKEVGQIREGGGGGREWGVQGPVGGGLVGPYRLSGPLNRLNAILSLGWLLGYFLFFPLF